MALQREAARQRLDNGRLDLRRERRNHPLARGNGSQVDDDLVPRLPRRLLQVDQKAAHALLHRPILAVAGAVDAGIKRRDPAEPRAGVLREKVEAFDLRAAGQQDLHRLAIKAQRLRLVDAGREPGDARAVGLVHPRAAQPRISLEERLGQYLRFIGVPMRLQPELAQHRTALLQNPRDLPGIIHVHVGLHFLGWKDLQQADAVDKPRRIGIARRIELPQRRQQILGDRHVRRSQLLGKRPPALESRQVRGGSGAAGGGRRVQRLGAPDAG